MNRSQWTMATGVLVVLFAVLEATANWMAATYQWHLGPMIIPGGALLIPLALLLRDQLHLRHPLSALWAALMVGVMANVVFGSGQTLRVAVASVVAFMVSFAVDSIVFDKLWRRSRVERMRYSNWASLPVDSLVFVPIAFLGAFPIGGVIAGQILAKLAMTELAILYVILNRPRMYCEYCARRDHQTEDHYSE